MLSNLLLLTFVTIFGSGDAGTTAFPLLEVPVGPRACAMGEAFTGLADDAGAVFWNPAGLGRLSSLQLGLFHNEWFADIRDENLGLAAPLGPGCLGFGAVYSTAGGIEVWNGSNDQDSLAQAQSSYATIGYGLSPVSHLSCGLALKGMYDNLIDQVGTGVAADVGALYEPLAGLRIGLAARNLGWGMKYGEDNVPLPIAARLGASWEFRKLRILFDANAPVSNRPDLHLGAEYRVHDLLRIRGGYRLGPQDYSTLSWLSGATAGLGLNLGMFSLDYALIPYGQLGLTHRIALSTSFPPSVYGRLRIRVAEFGTGRPVTARFILHGTQQGNSYTEPDGTFVVEGVEQGWVSVTAYADEYYPVTDSVRVEPRTTHLVRLVVRRSGYGSFWGAVYDCGTRRPLSARVSYAGVETGTLQVKDSSSSFTLRKLKAGPYSFTVSPLDSVHSVLSDTCTVQPGVLTSRVFLLQLKTSPSPDSSHSSVINHGSSLSPDSSNSPLPPSSFLPLEEAEPDPSQDK